MKAVIKTVLACCALSAAPAPSPAAAACGCAVGAPGRMVFEYGCCDGETTLSERKGIVGSMARKAKSDFGIICVANHETNT